MDPRRQSRRGRDPGRTRPPPGRPDAARADRAGLRLDQDPPDLTTVDVTDALFVGCRFVDAAAAADVVRPGRQRGADLRRGALPDHPGPALHRRRPGRGLRPPAASRRCSTRWCSGISSRTAGRCPTSARRWPSGCTTPASTTRSARTVAAWVGRHGPRRVVGVMGGHAVRRGGSGLPAGRRAGPRADPGRPAGRHRRRPGRDGGGQPRRVPRWPPGDELAAAIDRLALAPDFRDHEPYTAAALARTATAHRPRPVTGCRPVAWPSRPGCTATSRPTCSPAASPSTSPTPSARTPCCGWPGAAWCSPPGWAGTVQEVFQAATKAFYRADGASGPLVFLDRAFWTDVVPVAGAAAAAAGPVAAR